MMLWVLATVVVFVHGGCSLERQHETQSSSMEALGRSDAIAGDAEANGRKERRRSHGRSRRRGPTSCTRQEANSGAAAHGVS